MLFCDLTRLGSEFQRIGIATEKKTHESHHEITLGRHGVNSIKELGSTVNIMVKRYDVELELTKWNWVELELTKWN